MQSTALASPNAVPWPVWRILVATEPFALNLRRQTMHQPEHQQTERLNHHLSTQTTKKTMTSTLVVVVANSTRIDGAAGVRLDLWAPCVKYRCATTIHVSMGRLVCRFRAAVICVCVRLANMGIIASTVSMRGFIFK